MEYPLNSKPIPGQLKSLRVWLVDDDVDLCEAYYEYLSDFFDVSDRFYDSNEALETLKAMDRKKIPDIIMVDRFMPGLDGLSLSKEISKLMLPTTILLVTGDETPISLDEAESLNIVGTIKKPCAPALISNTLFRYGEFKELCEKIWGETLSLCRRSTLDWEFFLGQHADLERAFHSQNHKKTCLIAAIQGMDVQMRKRGIQVPNDSALPDLLKQFRKVI